jgi:hypothetical protein
MLSAGTANEGAIFMKTILLATAAVLALAYSASAVAARPVRAAHWVKPPTAGTLYSQYDNYGLQVPSQNFTSGSYANYNAVGADDFAIPAGTKWTITEVDALGVFGGGTNCSEWQCNTSDVVTFYRNNNYGHPGTVKYSVTVNCTASEYWENGNLIGNGNLACTIPGRRGHGLRLSGGTRGRSFWVSVVPNMNLNVTGVWSWITNQTTRNFTGQWQNPGNGYQTGCTTWTNTRTCFPNNDRFGDDYAFAVIGTAQ